ncbi:MAG TPA: hydrolase [Pseudomonas sp.]|nr:hydrolase [Pseudomonas sp.]
MRIKATDSTLLIVDIQERLFPVILDAAAMAEHTAWLQQVAKRVGVPVLLTEQYSKGLGQTIAALRDGVEDRAILEKLDFSAAGDGELFKRPGGERRQFVVCGCETHVCVLQTVLDLRARGNEVFVVEEGVSSRRASDKALALERMRQAGAHIVSREMVAFEWMERAGTELFKSISREFIR